MHVGDLLKGGLVGVHVLVIDDDEHARDFVQAVLQSSGAVVTAAGAVDALGAAALTADVIVCDLATVEAAEGGFLDRLRQLPVHRNRAVPAIAVVPPGASIEASRRRAVFQRSIAKPVDEIELRTVVRELTGR
jgi:ATP-binding cassette subfamily B protein